MNLKALENYREMRDKELRREPKRNSRQDRSHVTCGKI